MDIWGRKGHSFSVASANNFMKNRHEQCKAKKKE